MMPTFTPPPKRHTKHWILSGVEDIYINCLKLNLTYLRTPFLTDPFFHMYRLVFLSWLQFVQCLCILFLFYLTVLIACIICFYYNVCDCHAFIKGNLLTYLSTSSRGSSPTRPTCAISLSYYCGELNGEVAILAKMSAKMSVSVSWNAAFTHSTLFPVVAWYYTISVS